jgi:hypothetical protein
MILAIRKSFAVLAACGLAVSVFAYLGSYAGTTMDSIFRLAIALVIGIFVLLLLMYALDYEAVTDRGFFYKGFSDGMPKWVIPTITVFGLFFAIHFVLFLIESHAASPQIKDGQYVLDNHGQIMKVISQRDYLHLKGAELRLFAAGWMFFYFVLAAYWWFPRSRERHSENASRETTTSRLSK